MYTIFVKTAIVGQNKAGSVLRYYSEIRYAEFKKMIGGNIYDENKKDGNTYMLHVVAWACGLR